MAKENLADQGLEKRMETMMAEHGDALLRLCFLWLHDRELARDAVQETFLKAYRKLSTFRGDSSERTWLTHITINSCRDMKRNAWFRLFNRDVSLDDLPEPAYIQRFEDDTVLQTVLKLPAKYRDVILLYYYQGLTQEEAAQVLNLPLSTVKTHLKRAKDRLRITLKGWFEE